MPGLQLGDAGRRKGTCRSTQCSECQEAPRDGALRDLPSQPLLHRENVCKVEIETLTAQECEISVAFGVDPRRDPHFHGSLRK